MLGLRKKLALAFGGLLALLLVVGATSLAVLGDYSSTLERIFRDNYDSVHYAQQMQDAVDDLDSLAEKALWEEGVDDDSSRRAASAKFEKNLQQELANITLPGESEAAAALARRWKDYESAVTSSLASGGDAGARRRVYQDVLAPAAHEVRELAQRIIDLNMANMVSVDGEVRVQAISSRRTMLGLMLLGTIVAATLIVGMARSILVPLGRLTAFASEIAGGNLDVDAKVTSSDEIGKLAATFHTMAQRLREAKQSDRARLARTERTTQLALDSFPDPVMLVGPEGRIDLANQAAESVLGLSAGGDFRRDDHASLRDIVARTLATGEPFRPTGYDAALRPEHGDGRSYQPRAVPVVLDDGTIAGVTLVLTDVTSLRLLDQSKSNLLSVVSHELKSPLTSIRMATHLLQEEKAGPLTPRQRDLVAAAGEDSERLHTILESLLDMSRIESGRALIDLEAVAPSRLLREASAEVTSRYRDAKVALRAEADPSCGDVLADVARIRHVFTNLLENALRFSKPGGEVSIRASADGAFASFAVSDAGPGIAAEHLARVFDRFYRVPDQSSQSGAGLGLAIVKEIVEAHGGSVSVESQAGRGTTFRVRLRLAPTPSA